MKALRWLLPLLLLGWLILSCMPRSVGRGGSWRPAGMVSRFTAPRTFTPPAGEMRYTTLAGMSREIGLRADMVPRGTHGRKVVRPMNPRYITIHSTQNFSANASKHALALNRGALRAPKRPGGNRIGYLIWHFTVDDRQAIQHMPVSEQGEHADFDGPGNRLSIGIEMCEHRGSNIAQTVDRTARLTAILMKRQGIPLRNVVPHYHWPRRGQKPPNKNCPHFLLDNGRPGPKWRAFLARVNYHHQRLGTPR